MSISTVSELQTALVNWSNRSDISARVPEIISLVEARFNRFLRVRAMESEFPSVALTSGAAPLPADFLAFKELRCDAVPSYALEPRPLQWVRDHSDQASLPRYYAVDNAQVVCWPQAGNIKGTYYAAIPSLNAQPANWLLTAYPDAYLYACLEEVALYVRDAALMQVSGQRAQAVLDQIQGQDNANAMNGGPLQVRVR